MCGYRSDADAIADGKKLYTSNCIVCHDADGTGKMGPTIVGKDVVYKQVLTDPGMFAIIYGRANGCDAVVGPVRDAVVPSPRHEAG